MIADTFQTGLFRRHFLSRTGLGVTALASLLNPQLFADTGTPHFAPQVRRIIWLSQTDDFSYNVVKDLVPIQDQNATALHLLGINHTKLTHRFQSRDYRLTDVHGEVLKEIVS